jgi:hypothetical protein
MKTIAWVGMTVIGINTSVWAADAKPDDVELIRSELKPLRQKAYSEPDVIAERKKLDAAYRAYWEVVRETMKRLDPTKTDLIDRDVTQRKSLGPIAAPKSTPAPEKATVIDPAKK